MKLIYCKIIRKICLIILNNTKILKIIFLKNISSATLFHFSVSSLSLSVQLLVCMYVCMPMSRYEGSVTAIAAAEVTQVTHHSHGNRIDSDLSPSTSRFACQPDLRGRQRGRSDDVTRKQLESRVRTMWHVLRKRKLQLLHMLDSPVLSRIVGKGNK